MILLDTDILIDLLRKYPPAMKWFDTLPEEEDLTVSGYVVFELIQGCRNKMEQGKVQKELAHYGVVWLPPKECEKALEIFAEFHLSHKAGLLDVLIGQTATYLNAPLYTFNQKHYSFIPEIKTFQPYTKNI